MASRIFNGQLEEEEWGRVVGRREMGDKILQTLRKVGDTASNTVLCFV